MPSTPAALVLKRELRREIRQRLASLSNRDISRDSTKLVRALTKCEEFKRARTIALYASFGSEVHVGGITEIATNLGKRVFYPRVNGGDIVFREAYGLKDVFSWGKSSYGIHEPPVERPVVRPDVLDLVVVPGLAFDTWGGRLGQGRGFYDKFLRQRSRGSVIALAFELQVVDQVPTNEWDYSIDKVLYPAREGIRDAVVKLKTSNLNLV